MTIVTVRDRWAYGDGDAYADCVDLQQALDACGWADVCRAAKNTQVEVDGTWRRLDEIDVQLGRRTMWRQVRFTASAYKPVQVIGWWGSGYDEPLWLVTRFAWLIVMTRGAGQLLADTWTALARLPVLGRASAGVAACLADLCLIYLDTLASQPH